jgi:hypothetical protein
MEDHPDCEPFAASQYTRNSGRSLESRNPCQPLLLPTRRNQAYGDYLNISLAINPLVVYIGLMNNRTIEIESNPKGSGVLAYICHDGKRDLSFVQKFPTLGAAIGHFEKLAARQYRMMTWERAGEIDFGRYA